KIGSGGRSHYLSVARSRLSLVGATVGVVLGAGGSGDRLDNNVLGTAVTSADNVAAHLNELLQHFGELNGDVTELTRADEEERELASLVVGCAGRRGGSGHGLGVAYVCELDEDDKFPKVHTSKLGCNLSGPLPTVVEDFLKLLA